MIEQVKGFSYSAASLLGANSLLHDAVKEGTCKEHSEQSITEVSSTKSWWRISFTSPKMRGPVLVRYFLVTLVGFAIPGWLVSYNIMCLREILSVILLNIFRLIH